MIVVVILLVIAVIVLGVMFYFMEKRQSALDLFLDNRQKQLDAQLAEMVADTTAKLLVINEKIDTFKQNSVTLRENQDILAKDIETLLHEFKKFQKKVNREL